MLRQYVNAFKSIETDKLSYELIWLYVPDFTHEGKMMAIESIPNKFDDGEFWHQMDECAGFIVSDGNCPLRVSEMELISY